MLWRYLKIQARMLFYGMIGPVFVFMYFAADKKDSFMKSFLWSGLLITAVAVLVAVGMTIAGAKSEAEMAKLEQTGVLALAHVVDLQETGTRIEDQPLVKLHLRISVPGIQPFDSQDRVLAPMSRASIIASRTLVALVDPVTNEYQIDWERSALVSGVLPVNIGVDEEDHVYNLTGHVEAIMEIMRILKANGVPWNNMVALRSNPAARQQVLDVVRKAAAQRAPAQRQPPQ
jgi:hypothetical protein